jgi:outer membrane receptor protein involved in Fe transport
MKKSFAVATVGTATLLSTGLAIAADADNAATSDQVQTVTVTANKRGKESLQEVPMSISAFTAAQLEQRNVTNFEDYGTTVPNLSFGATGAGALASRTVSIRGVAGDDTTGFYIDETPVPASLDPHIVGIERIEVLRGPQGSLYGARSMGGTIRLITQKPDFQETSGFLKASGSRTSGAAGANYTLEGGLNTPLSPNHLVLRANAFYEHEAGFFKRAFPTTPGGTDYVTVDNVAAQDVYGGSEALEWKASNDLSVTQRLMFQRTSINGYPYADFFITPGSTAPFEPTNFTQVRRYDLPEGGVDKWTLSSVDLKYKVDKGEWVSSTSYFHRNTNETEDGTDFLQHIATDFIGITAPISPAPVVAVNDTKRYVQELRYSSNYDGPFQFVAGLYLSRKNDSHVYPPGIVPGINAQSAVATGVPGGVLGTDNAFSTETGTHTTEKALFGEASYEVTKSLKATLGMRAYRVTVSSDPSFQDGFAVGGSRIDFPAASRTEQGVNPKAQLQYKFTPDFMVYTTAAKGFRPGGVTPGLPDTDATGCKAVLAASGLTAAQTQQYASDSLWSYELGAKSSFWNKRVTVDGAIYRIDWSNIQQNINTACGFNYTGNTGAAKINGAELEVHARPMAGLDLSLGLGYADARVTESGGTSPQKVGDHIAQVPTWTGNFSATYTAMLNDDLYWDSNITYGYVGSSYSINNGAPILRPSYGLLNAQTGLTWGRYKLSLFGKNLLNKHANLSDSQSLAVQLPNRPRIVTNQPRTFGVMLTTTF